MSATERRGAISFSLSAEELEEFAACFAIPADGGNRSKTLQRMIKEAKAERLRTESEVLPVLSTT